MGTANISCKLTNLGKFKCYTKSGSKIVYEDDGYGLNKLQSFIIFPNKTTLKKWRQPTFILGRLLTSFSYIYFIIFQTLKN